MSQLSTASESSSECSEYSPEYSPASPLYTAYPYYADSESSGSPLSIASEYEYTDSEGSLADFIVHDTDSNSDSDPDYFYFPSSPSQSSQSSQSDSETSSLKKDDAVPSSN